MQTVEHNAFEDKELPKLPTMMDIESKKLISPQNEVNLWEPVLTVKSPQVDP